MKNYIFLLFLFSFVSCVDACEHARAVVVPAVFGAVIPYDAKIFCDSPFITSGDEGCLAALIACQGKRLFSHDNVIQQYVRIKSCSIYPCSDITVCLEIPSTFPHFCMNFILGLDGAVYDIIDGIRVGTLIRSDCFSIEFGKSGDFLDSSIVVVSDDDEDSVASSDSSSDYSSVCDWLSLADRARDCSIWK